MANKSDVDPVSGLSGLDKNMLKTSWSKIESSLNDMAVDFLIKLLTDYPQYLETQFPAFKGMSKQEMKENAKFQKHAVNVLSMMGTYAKSSDDAKVLVGHIQKINNSHSKRGLPAQAFEDLAKIFVPFLKERLGSAVTEDTANAWNKLLGAQISLYKAHLEKA